MFKVRAVIVALALGALASACSEQTYRTERIRAVREGSGIRLTNLTEQATAFQVFEANSLALYSFEPCQSTSTDCLRIPAKGSVLVPLTDIVGYDASTTKDVTIQSWWVLTDGSQMFLDMDTPISLKL